MKEAVSIDGLMEEGSFRSMISTISNIYDHVGARMCMRNPRKTLFYPFFGPDPLVKGRMYCHFSSLTPAHWGRANSREHE